MPTESTTFTIEQLRQFMSENDIERNIIHYYSGLQMPSIHYAAAFEHWCVTGENVMDEWDNIQELIVLTKKSAVGDVIKVGSDIQFISESMLIGFRDVIVGTTFWNIKNFLQEEDLSLESCVAFVDEVNRLLEEDKECAARYQKRQDEKIKKEEDRKSKLGIVYVITNGVKHKIGQTTNVLQRVKGLQTSNPDTLQIVMQYEIKGYELVKKLLHEKYATKRVIGEWFDLSASDIQDIKDFLSKY